MHKITKNYIFHIKYQQVGTLPEDLSDTVLQ